MQKKNTPKCDFPIAQHMNAFVQAFKKHLNENHGLLANLIKGIKPPVPIDYRDTKKVYLQCINSGNYRGTAVWIKILFIKF